MNNKKINNLDQRLNLNHPIIMGILNLTPDSFSDGGKYNTLKTALKKVREMEEQGADIIDIGGESTGPKTSNISSEQEIKRIIPILKKIREQSKLPISIDTCKAKVAQQALAAGANIINDITAFRNDSKLAKVAAEYQCPIIIMYSKDQTPRTTIQPKNYQDVIKTIINFFKTKINFAKKQGIKSKNIIIDPGLGHFISSVPKYSYEIIARLKELKKLKHKMLIGISRKSFLGGKMETRDHKGASLSAIAYLNGASIIRTHDVKGVKNFFETFF
jgi:dihydropteroate synthase